MLSRPAPVDAAPRTSGGILGDPSWPLALVLVAFPLWWILGFSGFVAMIFAVPMAVQLWRQRQVVVPKGFGWWLLFLVWVCLGALVLWVDAPGAVPGGGGASRMLVFVYRVCWYLTCTVVLLWLANSSRRGISFVRVCSLVGYLFVFAVLGGLLGVFAAHIELRSVLELVLPGGIRSNSFVKSIIHPGLADVQRVLGRPEARPKAPFAFANSWGSNLALTLPFFLVGWMRYGRRWQRLAAIPVLILAAIPVVYSLNRGLWASLLLGGVFYLALQVSRGRVIALFISIIAAVIAALLFVASPLGTIVTERMANQHSNDRRGQLLTQTVWSTTTGSPVIGFGSTRDVQGSFASIAGASTPDCKACGVPPLGTQGHLWMVIFSQGLVGAVLFLAFFLTSFFRSWRCRSTPEVVATCVLLFFALQMFVYDTLGMPLYLIMIAIALAWREQSRAVGSESYLIRVSTLRMYIDGLREITKPAIVLVMIGGLVGLGVGIARPTAYVATERLLLAPSPSHLVTGLALNQTPQEITIDTEAALLLSEGTLSQVAGSEQSTEDLRRQIQVTAEPNTSVLVVKVRDSSASGASTLAKDVSAAYLDVRRKYLLDRREQVLAALRDRLDSLATLGVATPGVDLDSQRGGRVAAEMQSVDEAISAMILTPTVAGEVLNSDPATALPQDFPKFVGSGLAVGIGLTSLMLFSRLTRRREDSLYESYQSHPDREMNRA